MSPGTGIRRRNGGAPAQPRPAAGRPDHPVGGLGCGCRVGRPGKRLRTGAAGEVSTDDPTVVNHRPGHHSAERHRHPIAPGTAPRGGEPAAAPDHLWRFMNDIPAPGSVSFPALGTTATLLVADPRRLETATAVLNDELAAIDAACSRFRPDSELSRVNHAGGARLTVSALFAEALETALHGAEISGGAVDPTVGAAVMALGYDRTFTALPPATTGPVRPLPAPARGHGVEWDGASRSIRLPPGCLLDFGATAKALAADRAARHASAAANCGVLVNLGGDLSIWGEPSPGGWRVAILDDHAAPVPDTAPTVRITGGGTGHLGNHRTHLAARGPPGAPHRRPRHR